MRSYRLVKRGTDIAIGGAALLISLPVQAVVAVAIRRSMGRPVLFRQDRPGRGGQIFTMIKFRTMLHADAHHATDNERLTPLGKLLRSTSLDELPTLWNVVRGDMSLVGPRPLLVDYLPLYTPDQARRHEVRPGVTGLAQVSGRNNLPWDERFTLDVEYVDGVSPLMDIRIILRTLGKVLKRSDVVPPGEGQVTRFKGTAPSE